MAIQDRLIHTYITTGTALLLNEANPVLVMGQIEEDLICDVGDRNGRNLGSPLL